MGRPRNKGSACPQPHKSIDKTNKKANKKNHMALFFADFFILFPPYPLPFPGFMGWKQLKQCRIKSKLNRQ